MEIRWNGINVKSYWSQQPKFWQKTLGRFQTSMDVVHLCSWLQFASSSFKQSTSFQIELHIHFNCQMDTIPYYNDHIE
jgi:hypothetical protein